MGKLEADSLADAAASNLSGCTMVRAPRKHSAARGVRPARSASLRSYTGTLPHNRLREPPYMCHSSRRSAHAAALSRGTHNRYLQRLLTADRAAQKEGQPTEQWLASTTTAGTRRASRRPRPPARRRRRPPGRTRPGAPAATRRTSGATPRAVTIATGRPAGTRRARARPAPRRDRREGRRRAGRHRRTRHECRRWRAARRERHHQQPTRRPAPTSKTGAQLLRDQRRPCTSETNFQERRNHLRARGPVQQQQQAPAPTHSDSDVADVFSFARHNRVPDIERLLVRGVLG